MSDTQQAFENGKDAVKDAVNRTRNELGDTLDAIEDKLNVPKRAGELKEKVQRSYEENPVPWIVGATAAVIAIGGLVAWAIFSDD